MSPNRAKEDSHASVLAHTAEPNPNFNGILVHHSDTANLAISQLAI